MFLSYIVHSVHVRTIQQEDFNQIKVTICCRIVQRCVIYLQWDCYGE